MNADFYYDRLMRVRQAADVKRWHTKRTNREQTVGAHSYGVAVLVQLIDPTCRKEVLLAALAHDLPELDTGDIPAPVKWANPELALALAEVESRSDLSYTEGLTQEEEELVKLADSMELLFWAQDEVNMGNLHFSQTVKLIKQRIIKAPAMQRYMSAVELILAFNRKQGVMT